MTLTREEVTEDLHNHGFSDLASRLSSYYRAYKLGFDKAQEAIRKDERERVEELFADTPVIHTFIRKRGDKAGVENCLLIIQSEWQALKEKK